MEKKKIELLIIACSCALQYFDNTYLQQEKLTDTISTCNSFSSKKAAQANFQKTKNRSFQLLRQEPHQVSYYHVFISAPLVKY